MRCWRSQKSPLEKMAVIYKNHNGSFWCVYILYLLQVILLIHHPMGDNDVITTYSQWYSKVIATYSDVIVLHVCGHTHDDHFKVVREIFNLDLNGLSLSDVFWMALFKMPFTADISSKETCFIWLDFPLKYVPQIIQLEIDSIGSVNSRISNTCCYLMKWWISIATHISMG